MDKKAVEMNVATIIVVILAILVLVILALYFTGGMKFLWEKITPVPGAYEQTDLEQARTACTLYCSARDETSYCTHKFSIRFLDENGKVLRTETKYCDDTAIGAAREQECIGVGFNQVDCSTKRRG
ncbi:MAG: hypothetical protein ACPLXC_01325 [Candidatus Pacearchaeota archaeon]